MVRAHFTEQDLVEIHNGVQAGDEASRTRLYEACESYCWPVLLKRVGYENARDHLHEIYLKVLNNIERGKVERPEILNHYIFRVAWIETINSVREIMTQRSAKKKNGEDLAPDDPFSVASLHEEIKALKEVIATLPLIDQEILERFYLKEQPSLQIISELEMNPKTYYARKEHAVLKIRETISRLKKQGSLNKLLSRLGA